MGGEFTYPKMVPLVLTHSQMTSEASLLVSCRFLLVVSFQPLGDIPIWDGVKRSTKLGEYRPFSACKSFERPPSFQIRPSGQRASHAAKLARSSHAVSTEVSC